MQAAAAAAAWATTNSKGNSCCAKTKMLWGVLFQFMWAVVSLVVTALVACWAK
ncbi:transparent leaf area peptide [Zea mays]|nr:transparent leaf area peptide [Zea mays]|eukprot:NP_001338926.1 transparent leaf area peptide [Zea mays]